MITGIMIRQILSADHKAVFLSVVFSLSVWLHQTLLKNSSKLNKKKSQNLIGTQEFVFKKIYETSPRQILKKKNFMSNQVT